MEQIKINKFKVLPYDEFKVSPYLLFEFIDYKDFGLYKEGMPFPKRFTRTYYKEIHNSINDNLTIETHYLINDNYELAFLFKKEIKNPELFKIISEYRFKVKLPNGSLAVIKDEDGLTQCLFQIFLEEEFKDKNIIEDLDYLKYLGFSFINYIDKEYLSIFEKYE